MLDGIFGQLEQPITDGFVLTAIAPQNTFIRPDAMHTPACYVYWDFLRRTTATLDELARAGVKLDLSAPAPPNDFAYYQALARLNYFYQRLYDYMVVEGIDRFIPFFGPPPPVAADDLAKQDFINEVLNHFQNNVSVSPTTTGPGTMSVTYKYEPAVGFNNLGGLALDSRDAELLWTHLFSPGSNNFTILDQLFSLNTWVYVYARGRIHPDVYHPQFAGYINSATRSAEKGLPSIQVQCEDALKPLHKTVLRANPAAVDLAGKYLGALTGDNYTVFSHPLTGMSLEDIFRYSILGEDRTSNQQAYAPLGVLDYSIYDGDLNDYYNDQTITVADAEVAGGLGSAIRVKRRDPRYRSKLVIWGLNELVPYRALLPTKKPDFFSTDFRNRLETLQEAARRSMVEFYADCCGNFVVHPYRMAPAFLNRHVLGPTEVADSVRSGVTGVPPSTYILPASEVRNSSVTISDNELITVLDFTGEFPMTGSTTQQVAQLGYLRTIVFAPELVARYGIWYKAHTEPLVNTATTPVELELYALARLAYNNKDVAVLQLTIESRPEIRLARPIYLPDQRDLGYIVSIESVWPARGDATTSLSLTFLRKTDALPIDFTEWLVQSKQTATSLSPSDIETLVRLFKVAAGFGRTTNLSNVVSTPGAVLSDPTTLAIIDAARSAQSPSEDLGAFSTDLQEQIARAMIQRGLEAAAGGG